MKHVSLRDCAVRESVVHKELTIQHVAGKRNPADLFTKELRDGAHFRKLRNSFMTTREKFTIDSTTSVPYVSPLNHSLPISPPPLLDSTPSSPRFSRRGGVFVLRFHETRGEDGVESSRGGGEIGREWFNGDT